MANTERFEKVPIDKLVPYVRNARTHSKEQILWIEAELKRYGVSDFRFCQENDCYVCDSKGHFFSVCKRQYSRAGNLISRYRIIPLTGSIDKYGYVTYRVTVGGIKKHLKAHRMMLNAWIGKQEEKSVNHKDGDKTNNRLENLEWCTVAENNAHALRTGLFNPRKAKHKYCIPIHEWMGIYIMNKHCGYSCCELGRMHGHGHEVIRQIVKRVERILPMEALYGQ